MTAIDPQARAAEPAVHPTSVPAVGPTPAESTFTGPTSVEVLIHRSDRELALPAYAQPSDAGADLVTARDVTLGPGERAVVPTGLSIALPAGYVAFVHPRSGLAARHGLSVVNAPGTVDAGYRGEIKVILINTDRSATIGLRRGDRIAQLVVQRVEHAMFREVDELPSSVRGSGGFGSTGGFGSGRSAVDPAGPAGIAESAGIAETDRGPHSPATVAVGRGTAGVRPRA
jgi:dUTP pyrophosphatase